MKSLIPRPVDLYLDECDGSGRYDPVGGMHPCITSFSEGDVVYSLEIDVLAYCRDRRGVK